MLFPKDGIFLGGLRERKDGKNQKMGMNAIRREVERQALHGASLMPTLPLRERGEDAKDLGSNQIHLPFELRIRSKRKSSTCYFFLPLATFKLLVELEPYYRS